MKKLTEDHKEALLDQAIDFYYRSCKTAEICPILVGRGMSKVGSKFVFLRNAKCAEVKVRHTSTFLFCQATGQEFSEKIK